MGLNYEQTHALPVGELMDLIAIHQIQNGAAKLRQDVDDEYIIPNVR